MKNYFNALFCMLLVSSCASKTPKKELKVRSNYMGINSVSRSKASFGMEYRSGSVKRAYVSGRLLPSNDYFHGGYVDLTIQGGWK